MLAVTKQEKPRFIEVTAQMETTDAILPVIEVESSTITYTDSTTISIQETTTQIKQPETTKPPKQDKAVNQYYSEQDAIDLAKLLWRECGGVKSKTEQACVAWTVLNWVDIEGISVQKEVRRPNRFAFYENTRVDQNMLDLAYDVLNRWSAEKDGASNVGRVLPKDYLYFEGHDGHNHFRNAYKGDYTVWDFSLPSPYDN